jgi:hypothetical protein
MNLEGEQTSLRIYLRNTDRHGWFAAQAAEALVRRSNQGPFGRPRRPVRNAACQADSLRPGRKMHCIAGWRFCCNAMHFKRISRVRERQGVS